MEIPRATYRLQFTPAFGFREALRIVPYLRDLGISHLYASPIFRARPGSSHGYDVIDPAALNPELGRPEDFAALTDAVRAAGMAWLQDVVPNHMAYHADNPALADLLESGPCAAGAASFDVDWEHGDEGLRGRILAPFLGQPFGTVLERGELQLTFDAGGFAVRYFDHRFPLRIESYQELLAPVQSGVRQRLGEEHPDYIQLLGVLYVLKTLRADRPDPDRPNQVRFIKQTLVSLYHGSAVLRELLDTTLTQFNGRPGKPESFNALEALLADQWFRLAYWKVAAEEINYRRFFTINDLIGLVLSPEVFDRNHALVLDWLRTGRAAGLRIDHIDGLADPAGYLQRLRQAAPDAYLVVEKILLGDEELPDWPVQGTTGYDFLTRVNALFCHPAGSRGLGQLYDDFTGVHQSLPELTYGCKKLIIERHMLSDIDNLAHRLRHIASRHRYGSDITLVSLRRALIEVMAHFPRYRTYLGTDGERAEDHEAIRRALAGAQERHPELQGELTYLGRLLHLSFDDALPAEERELWRRFVRRFQQFTGPVMAKGVEDTLFYEYNRLLSLNEVGSDPDRGGLSGAAFHAFNQRRRARWPHSLNATATHDTKRGEDVRARLNVLSEIPAEWGRAVREWRRLNRSCKTTVRRRRAPDANDEYFLYQTLVGAFPGDGTVGPDFVERIRNYMVKAIREAKVHTAWMQPDAAYEAACLAFVDALLAPGSAFLATFLPFQRRVAHYGWLNALGQALLKVTAPGVPDLYQGTEFWDLHLVDPDNRQPVDFARRRASLARLRAAAERNPLQLAAQLLRRDPTGRGKQYVLWRALQLRRQEPELFADGDYLPLAVRGSGVGHLVAFARRYHDRTAVTVVPRLLTQWIAPDRLPLGAAVWGDTLLELPSVSSWYNLFTGEHLAGGAEVPVAAVLQTFPMALLVDTQGAAAFPLDSLDASD